MSTTITKLERTMIALENMREGENDGHSLEDFYSELKDEANFKDHRLMNVSKMDGVKEDELPHLANCIRKRFGNICDKPSFSSLHTFDNKNWPENVKLTESGCEEIDTLWSHFKDILEHAGCDIQQAKCEWRDLKLHINKSISIFRNMQPLYVWQRISLEDKLKLDYKNIMKIIHPTNIHPLSNAS